MQTLIFDQRAPAQAASTAALEKALAPIRDHLASFAVLPSFVLDEPSTLLVATQHYAPGARLPGGVTLSVLGDVPVTQANAHLLANDRLGTGVSAYTVRETVDEAALLERFEQARKTLPRLSPYAPLHGVALLKYRQDDALRFAVAVRANDAPAAIKLLELATQAEPPATLEQLAAAPEYSALLASSEAYRRQTADAVAAALGVTLEPVPFVSAATHSIVRGDGGRLTVYHDVYNTEAAAASGALVRVGAHGGYVHVKPTEPAWRNAALSSLAASTGPFDPAVHRASEPVGDRVQYHAPLGVAAHSLSAERAAARTDPLVRSMIDQSSDRPLSTTDMHFVAGVAPDLPAVQYGSTAELVAIAAAAATKALPVPIDHPVLAEIAAAWPDLKRQLPPDYTLAQAFASEYPVERDPLLEMHSAHEPTHIDASRALEQAETTSTGVHYAAGVGFGGRHRPRPFWNRWAWRGGRGYGRHYGRNQGAAVALDVLLLAALGVLLAQK